MSIDEPLLKPYRVRFHTNPNLHEAKKKKGQRPIGHTRCCRRPWRRTRPGIHAHPARKSSLTSHTGNTQISSSSQTNTQQRQQQHRSNRSSKTPTPVPILVMAAAAAPLKYNGLNCLPLWFYQGADVDVK